MVWLVINLTAVNLINLLHQLFNVSTREHFLLAFLGFAVIDFLCFVLSFLKVNHVNMMDWRNTALDVQLQEGLQNN